MSEGRTIVIDTSVFIKWLSTEMEECLEQATLLLDDIEGGRCNAHAPVLSLYEVGNALLKGKKFTVTQADGAFELLHLFPIQYHAPTLEMENMTYAIAHGHDRTYYDATFLALAKLTGGPLVTDDSKQHAAIKGITVLPLAAYASWRR